jgi:hypothetical protein
MVSFEGNIYTVIMLLMEPVQASSPTFLPDGRPDHTLPTKPGALHWYTDAFSGNIQRYQRHRTINMRPEGVISPQKSCVITKPLGNFENLANGASEVNIFMTTL